MEGIRFSGGTVVPIGSAAAAVMAAAILGQVTCWPDRKRPPRAVPFILLVAAPLWFGLNGASMVASRAEGHAFLNPTAAAGFVDMEHSILIGILTAAACLLVVPIKTAIRFDDCSTPSCATASEGAWVPC